MIQRYTFTVPTQRAMAALSIAAMTEVAEKLAIIRRTLKGFHADPYKDHILIHLHVAGTDRWEIANDAKKLVLLIARRAKVPYWRHIDFVGLDAVENRRSLTIEEGRPVARRPPRAERQPNGARWDHISWWDGPSDSPEAE